MKAFPSNGFYEKTGGGEQPQKINPVFGMDLRDYFAGQVIIGLLNEANSDFTDDAIAELAYSLADAMMKAREK
jgi:hypothetical protein